MHWKGERVEAKEGNVVQSQRRLWGEATLGRSDSAQSSVIFVLRMGREIDLLSPCLSERF